MPDSYPIHIPFMSDSWLICGRTVAVGCGFVNKCLHNGKKGFVVKEIDNQTINNLKEIGEIQKADRADASF